MLMSSTCPLAPVRKHRSDERLRVGLPAWSAPSQLAWLPEIGFVDVDCYWKWLETALLIGVRPDR
jgi:hypothetical protein